MRKRKSRSLSQIEITAVLRLPFSQKALGDFLKKILKHLGFKRSHLSLFFVTDAEMKKWHRKLMGINSTTDVISLSQLEGVKSPNPLNSIGDIIVCVPEAKRRAASVGVEFSEELGRYVIHGLLHCIGYNDLTPKPRKRMWDLQEKLVKKFSKILESR